MGSRFCGCWSRDAESGCGRGCTDYIRFCEGVGLYDVGNKCSHVRDRAASVVI